MNEPIEKNDKPIIREVGLFIRKLRLEQDLTEKDMSKLCGVNVKSLSQIEQGKRDLKLTTLEKLAHGLGCSPGYVLSLGTKESRKDIDKIHYKYHHPEEDKVVGRERAHKK